MTSARVKWTAKPLVALFVFCCAGTAQGQVVNWSRQFGTPYFDGAESVSVDVFGGLYVLGDTDGSLGGSSAGFGDVYLTKYSTDGTPIWTRQFGTSEFDSGQGVSVDGVGGVYSTGITGGSLDSDNAGDVDVFVRRYDASGTLLWGRQVGSAVGDWSSGISSDHFGEVYVSGATDGDVGGGSAGGRDAFLTRFDSNGTLAWTRQFGTEGDDYSSGVSSDGLGNVFVTGWTNGSLDGASAGDWDAFLRKYDANGTLVWGRQLGTDAADFSGGVASDAFGNVYISGPTLGAFDGANAGSRDVFLAKYDANGTLEWTRQFGTESHDDFGGITTDPQGNVYVSGVTLGALAGVNNGGADAFVSKFDTTGKRQWTVQFGTSESEGADAITAGRDGRIYIAGATLGSLGGPSLGEFDAYVVSMSTDVPLSPGDGNLDGRVDGIDYIIWASAFGNDPAADPPGSPANGDFNGDGVVDGLDYTIWAENFGKGPNDIKSVPEPAAILSLLVGVVVVAWKRTRR